MKRLLAALLLVAASAFAQSPNGWQEMPNGWGEIQNGTVPYTSPSTGTLDLRPGTLIANNLTATALATPGAITVTPVLTQTGTINVVAGASLVDGDYFTIEYEAGLTIPVEFDATPGNGTTGGRIPFIFAPGDSAGTIRDGLITLLGAAAPTKVTAAIGGAAAITLTRIPAGQAGVSITENVTNAGFTVVTWGVTAATTYTYKLVWRAPDGTTTAAGAASSTAAGHATLSTANRNDLSWTAGPTGSVTDVYKTVGGTTGRIATGITATSLSDTGLSGAGEVPPTVNGTGVVTGRGVLATGTTVTPGTGTATARVGGVLYVSTTAQATTGTSEEILATYTMPAGTLARDGQAVRITATATHAANTNGAILRVRWGGIGGTQLASINSIVSGAGYRATGEIVRTGASAQNVAMVITASGSTSTVASTSAESLAGNVDIVVTGLTSTAAGDITFASLMVEALN